MQLRIGYSLVTFVINLAECRFLFSRVQFAAQRHQMSASSRRVFGFKTLLVEEEAP